MKRIQYFLTCIIVIGTSCHGIAQQNNTLTEAEKKAGWELLFDGKSTNGWRFYKDGEIKGWKVVDGVLYNSGIGSDHGGDIITLEKFKDFELSLEWKVEHGSNSGIFYHVQELDSVHAIYESGPEYQLTDDINDADPKYQTEDTQFTGANYAMNAPIGAKVKPIGEWNITRILIKGSHVEHWLNGVKVVEYELWTPEWLQRKNNCKWKECPSYGIAKEGFIGLQDHGGLTGFRNIKIRRL